MILHLTKEKFQQIYQNAILGSFQVDEHIFELKLGLAEEEGSALKEFKMYYELDESLSGFKYPINFNEENKLEINEVRPYAHYGFDLKYIGHACEKCLRNEAISYSMDREAIDLSNIKMKFFCQSCQHTGQEECICQYCRGKGRNTSTVPGLYYEKDNFNVAYFILKSFHDHYQSLIKYFTTKNKKNLMKGISLNAQIWDIAFLDEVLRDIKKRTPNDSVKELYKFFLSGLVILKPMDFQDFFNELTKKYHFTGENTSTIKDSIEDSGIDFIPVLFLNFMKFNEDLFSSVQKYIEEGVEYDWHRKYSDNDIITYAIMFAEKHRIDLDPRSTTKANILKLLKIMPEMNVFKAIEKSINGAVNYGVKQDLGITQKRGLAIRFLNDAHLRYDPDGTDKWEATPALTEWELEEWGLETIETQLKGSVEKLSKIIETNETLSYYYYRIYFLE